MCALFVQPAPREIVRTVQYDVHRNAVGIRTLEALPVLACCLRGGALTQTGELQLQPQSDINVTSTTLVCYGSAILRKTTVP